MNKKVIKYQSKYGFKKFEDLTEGSKRFTAWKSRIGRNAFITWQSGNVLARQKEYGNKWNLKFRIFKTTVMKSKKYNKELIHKIQDLYIICEILAIKIKGAYLYSNKELTLSQIYKRMVNNTFGS